MATRSPSPNLSRPKTPGFNNDLRKSKEIHQRGSVPKSSAPNSPSLRSSFEQKENLKLRSPSIFSSSSLKGSKNFMAPTVSAASKIIAASPRKKILQESNEVIVSSVTDCLEFPNKEESIGVVIDDVGSKSAMAFCSPEVTSSVEVKKAEFRIKNLQNVPSLSQIVPLDVDTSLPPYDPKTNYLSPRPQFLHYKPNPRIEHYLNREGEFLDVGDGRKLEDSFSLENSEDDATTLTDEKDSEGKQSIHSEAEELEAENETHFASEPEAEHKIKPLTRRPFTISKSIPFLLVLVLACIYVSLSDSPIFSSSMLKDHIQTLYFDDLHLRDYLDVANSNHDGLASMIKHWSTNSIAYFTSMNSPTKDDLGLYHFFNMTPAIDESRGLDLGCNHEMVTEQSIRETESEVSEIVKEVYVAVSAEEMKIEVLDEYSEMDHGQNGSEKIEMLVSDDVKEDDIASQKIEMEVSEDEIDANIVDIIEEEGNNELEQEAKAENTEIEPEIIGDKENYNDAILVTEFEQELSYLAYESPGVENEVKNTDIVAKSKNAKENIIDASSFDELSEFDEEYRTLPGLELLKSMNYGIMLGLALASLVLVSILVFLYNKQKQIPMGKKERQTTKKVSAVSGTSETYTFAEGVIGDSGSIEVSSSFNNTLRKREGNVEQKLSLERKLRRDSSASSSLSYGSFTTYERRSARKGSTEEEVVTPVRRSSRIRNHLTSP